MWKIYGPGNKAKRTKMIEDMMVLRAGKVRKYMDKGTNVLRIKRAEGMMFGR